MLSRGLRRAAGPLAVSCALILAVAAPAAIAGERVDLSSGWPAGWRRVGTEEGLAARCVQHTFP